MLYVAQKYSTVRAGIEFRSYTTCCERETACKKAQQKIAPLLYLQFYLLWCVQMYGHQDEIRKVTKASLPRSALFVSFFVRRVVYSHTHNAASWKSKKKFLQWSKIKKKNCVLVEKNRVHVQANIAYPSKMPYMSCQHTILYVSPIRFCLHRLSLFCCCYSLHMDKNIKHK